MNARISLIVCGLLLAPAGVFADSLWTSPANNQRPIIADHKACSVGDIVTIVVNENANLTSTQSKQTATNDSVNAWKTGLMQGRGNVISAVMMFELSLKKPLPFRWRTL